MYSLLGRMLQWSLGYIIYDYVMPVHATSGDAAAADKDDDAAGYVTMTSFCKLHHSGAWETACKFTV